MKDKKSILNTIRTNIGFTIFFAILFSPILLSLYIIRFITEKILNKMGK